MSSTDRTPPTEVFDIIVNGNRSPAAEIRYVVVTPTIRQPKTGEWIEGHPTSLAYDPERRTYIGDASDLGFPVGECGGFIELAFEDGSHIQFGADYVVRHEGEIVKVVHHGWDVNTMYYLNVLND